jgi:ATPase subunit of ABC transporter with duplicated ATPase domains
MVTSVTDKSSDGSEYMLESHEFQGRATSRLGAASLFDFYEQQRAVGERQRRPQFGRQQAMLAKEMKFIELFNARASHAARVQSRVKEVDKIERVEPPRRALLRWRASCSSS